jgi:hypothetical protein
MASLWDCGLNLGFGKVDIPRLVVISDQSKDKEGIGKNAI